MRNLILIGDSDNPWHNLAVEEALFDALVKETAEGIVATVSKLGDRADAIPPEERVARMTDVFAEGLPDLLDYLLSHKDETRLLTKCAAGSPFMGRKAAIFSFLVLFFSLC